MAKQPKPVSYIAAHIRRVLKDGGSAPHSAEVQWFFKEQVKSRGWYTNELRKLALRFRRNLLTDCGLAYMVEVADNLFRGEVLEEDGLAVELLRKNIGDFGDKEFRLFESWIGRVGNWASHDSLVSYLIGPMIAAEPKRKAVVFRWAKSKNRWYRRAASVALIGGTRQLMFFPDTVRLTELLLKDEDDMVQKGLGWLLRETVKHNRGPAVPYLLAIRDRTPRLVLRTACETLPQPLKDSVLGSRQPARHTGASNTR